MDLSPKETPYINIFIPETWKESALSILHSSSCTSAAPVVLICGAKNSGKTTFSRYLLNTFLSSYKEVGYLDTDVGQSEFTTPGCLSFHVIDKQIPDLSIMCLKTPERCFFYGDISSKRDPAAYLKCIYHLYDYFRMKYFSFIEHEDIGKSKLPLIVNTPGWVKGMGYDILVEMLRYISPTHVVQVRISLESKNLPKGAFWVDDQERDPAILIDIGAARQDSLNRSVLGKKDARLMRDLRIIAYFRQCIPANVTILTNKELAHSLAALPPYEVPISKIMVLNLHSQVSESELFRSLNATIVGLANSSEKPLPSKSCQAWCIGLGLIRGIDISRGIFYVITPVPHQHLAKVDLFLQGFIDIPTSLLQVHGCMSPYMSMNVLSSN